MGTGGLSPRHKEARDITQKSMKLECQKSVPRRKWANSHDTIFLPYWRLRTEPRPANDQNPICHSSDKIGKQSNYVLCSFQRPRPTNFSDPLTKQKLQPFTPSSTQKGLVGFHVAPPEEHWNSINLTRCHMTSRRPTQIVHAPASAICLRETNNLPRKGTQQTAHYLRVCMFSPNYPNKFKPAIIEDEVADFSMCIGWW